MKSERLSASLKLLTTTLLITPLYAAPVWAVTLDNPACYANPKAKVSYDFYIANNTGASTLTLANYTLGSSDGNYYVDSSYNLVVPVIGSTIASSTASKFCFMDGKPFEGNFIYYQIGPSPISNGIPNPGSTYSFAIQQWGSGDSTVYLNAVPYSNTANFDNGEWQTGASGNCPNTAAVSMLDNDSQNLICNEDYLVYLVSSSLASGAQSGKEAAAYLAVSDNPSARSQGSQSVPVSSANLSSAAAVGPTQLASRLHDGKRWTVVRHGADQSLAGRVAALDGSDSRFLACHLISADGHADERQRLYTYACQTAPVCQTPYCDSNAWDAAFTVTLPGRLFQPRPGHPDARVTPPRISMTQQWPVSVSQSGWNRQITPDGATVLLNKVIDDHQWTIAKTGQQLHAVLTSSRNASTPPRFAACQTRPAENQHLQLDCTEALSCKSTPCTAGQWRSFPTITLPESLFDPAAAKDYDRVFNWISAGAPHLFAPYTGITQQDSEGFYRYYPNTGLTLRYNSADKSVYYVLGAGITVSVGLLRNNLRMAVAAGY